MMPIYYVETIQGCGLRAATNLQQAIAEAKQENGRPNVVRVRKATDDDIAWVKAMGGFVPEEV